jgi:hypothetical protein
MDSMDTETGTLTSATARSTEEMDTTNAATEATIAPAPSEEEPKRRARKRKSKTLVDTAEPKPKRQRKPKVVDATEEEFQMSWICAECKEAECGIQPEADQLLICEGPCRRLFHYPCANLKELPAEDQDYFCDDCTSKKHNCAICQQYGFDDVEVYCCSRDKCGLFFHESCLITKGVEVHIIKDKEEAEEEEATGERNYSGKRQFSCPGHCCWTCTQKDEKKKEEDEAAANRAAPKGKRSKKTKKSSAFETKTGLLVRCMVCPSSFHLTCIPPTGK